MITGDEAKRVADQVREICPSLSQLGDGELAALLSQAFKESLNTLNGIEGRIKTAGCMPGDIVVILLHYGAIAAVMEDLLPDDERRTLVQAGRKLGALIAEKFGEKIRALLKRDPN